MKISYCQKNNSLLQNKYSYVQIVLETKCYKVFSSSNNWSNKTHVLQSGGGGTYTHTSERNTVVTECVQLSNLIGVHTFRFCTRKDKRTKATSYKIYRGLHPS